MKKTLLIIGLIASCSIYAQDPVVLNANFDALAKNGSANTCSCSHWMNTDLVAQAGSSTSGGEQSIKFDKNQADGMYQELAVLANTEYKLTLRYRIDIDTDSPVIQLETRILKGSGFPGTYTFTTYPVAGEAPNSGYGYSTIADVENSANNIAIKVTSYPGDTGWYNEEITFNSGSETVIAIFARGIGRPTTAPSDSKPASATWSSGSKEARIDKVTLINNSTASVKEDFATNFSLYPNPSKGSINIQSKNVEISKVQLYNVTGQKVLDQKGLVNGGIDVSKFAKGVYVLKIESGDKFYTNKIIVE